MRTLGWLDASRQHTYTHTHTHTTKLWHKPGLCTLVHGPKDSMHTFVHAQLVGKEKWVSLQLHDVTLW